MFFYKNLVYLCNKYKISQNKLGNDLNVPISTIKSIFQGKSKNPSLDLIIKIKEYFKISLDDLILKDLSEGE